jgi:hypothetical protein
VELKARPSDFGAEIDHLELELRLIARFRWVKWRFDNTYTRDVGRPVSGKAEGRRVSELELVDNAAANRLKTRRFDPD